MTLEFQEFINRAADFIQGQLGEGYHVSVRETVKNNGEIRKGIVIGNGLSNISPCIYLEEYYRNLTEGRRSLEELLMEIMGIYKQAAADEKFDVSVLNDYRSVRDRIRGRLVNTEKNRKNLLAVPHREFLDMSITYAVWLGEEKGRQGNIGIDNDYMERLGITEAELFADAKANMEKVSMCKIWNIIRQALGGEGDDPGIPEDTVSMYVLCNKSRLFGAIGMLDQKVMRRAAEIFGGDFMILPSSIHELILIPGTEKPGEAEQLAKMVQEINRTQVLEEEVLSGHVYRYNHRTGEIVIAA